MMRVMLVSGSLLGAVAAGAEAPLDVGTGKQLFIDKQLIADGQGIELRMNPAQKLGLILDELGQPSPESGHTSRVVEDGGKIHLYVGAGDLHILESDDGIRFRRIDAQIGRGDLPTIFLDRHDPDPGRRYKLFWLQAKEPFDVRTDGIYAACSADGLRFTTVGRVLPLLIDNPAIVDWDARIGRYVIFTRAFSYDSENQRRVARLEVDDPLKPWPYTPGDPKRERLSTENVPVVLEADAEDDPHSDIYYNAATDISDAVAILGYLFLGEEKVPCEQAGDANDDGTLDITDAVYVLSFLFLGGKSIELPVGTCGSDPTGYGLPCGSFASCE